MDITLKNNFIERWNKYFPSANLPVAFYYSNELHNAHPALKHNGHHCLIADIMKILKKGAAMAFNAGNIGCGGGMRYCGFTDTLREGFEYFLSYGIPGKMKGERYKKDPETVKEFMKHTAKEQAPAEWLIVKRFDMLNETDKPEAIIFFVKPDELAGLFTLANYDRTDPYGVKAPFCAGCGSVIQYPYLENKKDNPDCILGGFDSSARPYITANMLSFAIPFTRFIKLVSYMDESFLITPTWELMRKRISKNI
ncbi:MAG: DUF169 domain-containing protein [Bacteroidales bacterium]|nr:DUF169 domain-containing protein [Bacteroidales bacterium]